MRFYTTAENRRGNEIGTGLLAGNPVHTRGWDAGVKVVPHDIKGKPDVFRIYMTGGSHAATGDVLLGEVRQTDDGPLFYPAAGQYTNGKVYRFDGSN
jgi:hypothetical protein